MAGERISPVEKKGTGLRETRREKGMKPPMSSSELRPGRNKEVSQTMGGRDEDDVQEKNSALSRRGV